MVLQIKNLSKQEAYKNITFDLRRREILGLTGVVGSGIRELTRTLFGIIAPDSGSIHLNGNAVKFRNPTDAIKQGIGYIPEERGDEGLILYFSPAPNITLPHLTAATRAGFLSPVKEEKICNRWVDELNIKVPTKQTMCGNLSGGNQQKVVISKWLETNVEILIMDHPTRGIDVGAKEEVYALIRQLTGQGISIILIADSLEELIGLSNTILIMKDGELTKSMPSKPGAKPTPQDLIRYMV
jgi:ribose transport system ATP-binding protein